MVGIERDLSVMTQKSQRLRRHHQCHCGNGVVGEFPSRKLRAQKAGSASTADSCVSSDDQQPIRRTKIGRNEPCFGGSGKSTRSVAATSALIITIGCLHAGSVEASGRGLIFEAVRRATQNVCIRTHYRSLPCGAWRARKLYLRKSFCVTRGIFFGALAARLASGKRGQRSRGKQGQNYNGG